MTLRAEVYAIADCPAGRLAIMPRPRAGDWLEDEIQSWRQQGLHTIVSLLEDNEISELGLEREAKLCEDSGLYVSRLPIPDRGVPAVETTVSELVDKLIAKLHAGGGVGIHCRIGVGRSALIAACVLAGLGMQTGAAWEALRRARGLPVPDTEAQRDWVDGWHAGYKTKIASLPKGQICDL